MATRIISSVIGILIGITVLFLSDTPVLNAVLAVFAVIGIYELYKANKCLEYKAISVLAFFYGASSPFICMLENQIYEKVFTTATIIGFFACYFFVHKKMSIEKLFYAICVPFFLSYSLISIYQMHEMSEKHGVVFILLALCGAWIADSAAYFVGTFLGKHKLCPDISPKKTIEGFAGGLIFNGLFFIIFNLIYVTFFAEGCSVNYISSFFLGVTCALIGTVGDLSASLIKRQCGIKDFGKLMPGHGGFMDRFDSVLFVAPFMYMYLSLFNIYLI